MKSLRSVKTDTTIAGLLQLLHPEDEEYDGDATSVGASAGGADGVALSSRRGSSRDDDENDQVRVRVCSTPCDVHALCISVYI